MSPLCFIPWGLLASLFYLSAFFRPGGRDLSLCSCFVLDYPRILGVDRQRMRKLYRLWSLPRLRRIGGSYV
ncbi:hypothetical protein HMPREF1986_02551 [Oribacterium sp. oral taxon 078 str. F0263]|nr:hypothetical protein HMPREF1986_02551 [Oribacterium sp. oral taxon 078 str. F0263]